MKILFGFIFSIAVSALFAQPTLTKDNVGYIAGSIFNINETLDYVDISGSGANQEWDYSSLTVDVMYTERYIATDTMDISMTYPTANVAYELSTGAYQFSNVNSLAIQFLGEQANNVLGSAAFLSDPKDVLRFPMTYQSNYLDSFAGAYEIFPGIDTPIEGYLDVYADAYGSLTLPWGTIDNVLRVNSVEHMVIGEPGSSSAYDTEKYTFYAPGNHNPVMEVIYIFEEGQAQPSVYAWYLSENSVGIDEQLKALEIKAFPNPVIDQLSVSLVDFSPGNLQFRIMDMSGRICIEERFAHGYEGAIRTFDVRALQEGMYLLEIYGDKQRANMPLIKQ